MTNDTSKQNTTNHSHEQEMTEDLQLDTQLKQAEEKRSNQSGTAGNATGGSKDTGSGQGGSEQSGAQNERNLQGGQQTGLMRDGDSFNTTLGGNGENTLRQGGNMGQEATSMQSAARSDAGDQNSKELSGGIGNPISDLDRGIANDQQQSMNLGNRQSAQGQENIRPASDIGKR
jgi:hypothetical protein